MIAYLSGAMENAQMGSSWRNDVTQWLKDFDHTVINPYESKK